LSSISELPTILKEEEPVDEEKELFTSIYKEKENE
jgi:hypothetical protein